MFAKTISVLTLSLTSVWLLGCNHTFVVGTPTQDRVWRAEMVRTIAFDLRDGTLDYVWPTNVSQATREAILADAIKLNQNSTGER